MKKISLMMCFIIMLLSFTNVYAVDTEQAGVPLKLEVSKNNVVIKNKGASDFIDVFAEFKDGTSVNINRNAEWKSDDMSVAWVFDGRILAEGKGDTFVTVSYKGLKQRIHVKVLSSIGPEEPKFNILITDDERSDIIIKCSQILNCV